MMLLAFKNGIKIDDISFFMLEIAFWCGIGRRTMRLIDADKLLEETRKDRDYAEKNGFLDMYYERQTLIDRIKSQPTAYDVEKVVDELKDASWEETDISTVIYIDDAIEIAKQGGISDDVCECRLLNGYNFLFKTSCGDVFEMENGFKYCPYCGKKIKVVE